MKQADALNKQALHFYSEKLIPIVKRDLASEVEIEFDITLNEEELAIYIKYPSSFHNGYVKDSVKLEIGPLAAWTPWETKEISSFITQEYQQLFENKAFPVLITKPVRTFWEKAVILHQEAHREDGEVPLRYFHHYYDLYKMYSTFVKTEAFANLDLLNEVRTFTMTFYYRSWAKFEEVLSTIKKLEDEINGLKK